MWVYIYPQWPGSMSRFTEYSVGPQAILLPSAKKNIPLLGFTRAERMLPARGMHRHVLHATRCAAVVALARSSLDCELDIGALRAARQCPISGSMMIAGCVQARRACSSPYVRRRVCLDVRTYFLLERRLLKAACLLQVSLEFRRHFPPR